LAKPGHSLLDAIDLYGDRIDLGASLGGEIAMVSEKFGVSHQAHQGIVDVVSDAPDDLQEVGILEDDDTVALPVLLERADPNPGRGFLAVRSPEPHRSRKIHARAARHEGLSCFGHTIERLEPREEVVAYEIRCRETDQLLGGVIDRDDITVAVDENETCRDCLRQRNGPRGAHDLLPAPAGSPAPRRFEGPMP
jgi:hypothetical protein